MYTFPLLALPVADVHVSVCRNGPSVYQDDFNPNCIHMYHGNCLKCVSPEHVIWLISIVLSFSLVTMWNPEGTKRASLWTVLPSFRLIITLLIHLLSTVFFWFILTLSSKDRLGQWWFHCPVNWLLLKEQMVLVWHVLFLRNLCWLLAISKKWLQSDCFIICSNSFPGIEVLLMRLYFLRLAWIQHSGNC